MEQSCAWLKLQNMVFLCSSGIDAVKVMAAYQPVVQACLHNIFFTSLFPIFLRFYTFFSSSRLR